MYQNSRGGETSLCNIGISHYDLANTLEWNAENISLLIILHLLIPLVHQLHGVMSWMSLPY
jgi:hypothetical protein